MATMDFEAGTIEVREDSLNYGPFAFDFTNAAPTGAVISSVVVSAYVGRVYPSDLLSGKTDITASLVDAALTAATGNYVVSVYLNYPTVTQRCIATFSIRSK
jgi:hypothetical protein